MDIMIKAKKDHPTNPISSLNEDSLKTVGQYKVLAEGRPDWIPKQNTSPVIQYCEHILYAFDKVRIFADLITAFMKLQYSTDSKLRKDFFIAYEILRENLRRARELRGPEPEIKKGKYPKDSKYDKFLSTWPQNPGTIFGFGIIGGSALEAAYTIAQRIEGSILSAQEQAMGRGQGGQFDSLKIDDIRIGSWLSGVFTDEIRRALGLPDSAQILINQINNWTISELNSKLNMDIVSLEYKLIAERNIFQTSRREPTRREKRIISILQTEPTHRLTGAVIALKMKLEYSGSFRKSLKTLEDDKFIGHDSSEYYPI